MEQFSPYAKDIISRYRRVEPWYGSIDIPFASFQTPFIDLPLINLRQANDDILITSVIVDFNDPKIKTTVFDKKMYRWDQNKSPVPIHAFASSTALNRPVGRLPIEYYLPAFDDLFFRFQQSESMQAENRTINFRGVRLRDRQRKGCDDKNAKTIENGRWVPSIDVVQVGSFTAASNRASNLLLNHSYRVFTQPKPFEWYIFGLAANWTTGGLVDTFVDIADLSVKENFSNRFVNGAQFFGAPTNYTAGWMPLHIAHNEITGLHKYWAWAEMTAEDFEIGIDICIDRNKPEWVGAYVLPPGKQFRFIVMNRCTSGFDDTKFSVVGQRWLPWDAERVPDVIS